MKVATPLSSHGFDYKNRIFMPAMASYVSTNEGIVTERILEHYRCRAEGGNLSLIVTEHQCVSTIGRAKPKQLANIDDSAIEGLSQLAQACKAGNSYAFAQISHAGAAGMRSVISTDPWCASAVEFWKLSVGLDGKGMGDELPAHAMTLEEIERVRSEFIAAAKRVQQAGFDGVEIHSAHGYLLNEFYSPLTNLRTDEYGGTLEERLRLLLEIIAGIQDELGDFPIAVRLGGCDYQEGGSTIEDAAEAARILETAGIVFIDLSGGLCRFTRPGHDEPGYFKDMAAAVKQVVDIPVLLTGGVATIEQAEKLLQEGVADIIGIGRALLRNPHWADEAFDGIASKLPPA